MRERSPALHGFCNRVSVPSRVYTRVDVAIRLLRRKAETEDRRQEFGRRLGRNPVGRPGSFEGRRASVRDETCRSAGFEKNKEENGNDQRNAQERVLAQKPESLGGGSQGRSDRPARVSRARHHLRRLDRRRLRHARPRGADAGVRRYAQEGRNAQGRHVRQGPEGPAQLRLARDGQCRAPVPRFARHLHPPVHLRAGAARNPGTSTRMRPNTSCTCARA